MATLAAKNRSAWLLVFALSLCAFSLRAAELTRPLTAEEVACSERQLENLLRRMEARGLFCRGAPCHQRQAGRSREIRGADFYDLDQNGPGPPVTGDLRALLSHTAWNRLGLITEN